MCNILLCCRSDLTGSWLHMTVASLWRNVMGRRKCIKWLLSVTWFHNYLFYFLNLMKLFLQVNVWNKEFSFSLQLLKTQVRAVICSPRAWEIFFLSIQMNHIFQILWLLQIMTRLTVCELHTKIYENKSIRNWRNLDLENFKKSECHYLLKQIF